LRPLRLKLQMHVQRLRDPFGRVRDGPVRFGLCEHNRFFASLGSQAPGRNCYLNEGNFKEDGCVEFLRVLG